MNAIEVQEADLDILPAVADLTRLRDPAEIWPAPEDCPDYPLTSGLGTRMGTKVDRAAAEARLSAILSEFNPSDAPLRDPSEAERKAALERFFTTPEPGSSGGVQRRFATLGFDGLRPATGEVGKAAFKIVEAVHLRGYLRRMDAEEAQQEDLSEGRAARKLQARVLGFTSIRAPYLAELEKLSEAEERHLQAKADALAHARCVELRRALRARHDDAMSAAQELGEDLPDLPEMSFDE